MADAPAYRIWPPVARGVPPTDGASESPHRHVRPDAPTSVSDAAKAFLSLPSDGAAAQDYPTLEDVEGWERFVETRDARVTEMFSPHMPSSDVIERRTEDVSGVRTFVLRPASVREDERSTLFLEIHGGALIQFGRDLAWMVAMSAAVARSGETWVPDYRMPPRHPYPAALDDCLTVYRRALEERAPEQIIVSGGSAGGNLAAAMLLRAKDDGLPMPAALVLLSPELDLTESGDSFRTNLGIDVMGSLMRPNLLYAGGHDLADPYVSPLFGDVTGFPPTFLSAGTREIFLSNAVRMHRKLVASGVPTELHIFEAMPHGGFGGGAPEDRELFAETRRFERKYSSHDES